MFDRCLTRFSNGWLVDVFVGVWFLLNYLIAANAMYRSRIGVSYVFYRLQWGVSKCV